MANSDLKLDHDVCLLPWDSNLKIEIWKEAIQIYQDGPGNAWYKESKKDSGHSIQRIL
jgi:hypothetical protein